MCNWVCNFNAMSLQIIFRVIYITFLIRSPADDVIHLPHNYNIFEPVNHLPPGNKNIAFDVRNSVFCASMIPDFIKCCSIQELCCQSKIELSLLLQQVNVLIYYFRFVM